MLTSISNEQTYKNKDLSLSPTESVNSVVGPAGVENTIEKSVGVPISRSAITESR